MPTFEFFCETCEVSFEELFLQKEEIERHRQEHPCPNCGGSAKRNVAVPVAFNFKAPAGRTQGSGVHGQSGVHDLDYPALDKAVGRSATKKWEVYNARKAERDKLRKEMGTNNVSTDGDGKPIPVESGVMGLREQAIKTFKKVKKIAEKGK